MVVAHSIYVLFDKDACVQLAEGDFVAHLSYWDHSYKVTILDAIVLKITESEVVFELNDSSEVYVNIKDIISWD